MALVDKALTETHHPGAWPLLRSLMWALLLLLWSLCFVACGPPWPICKQNADCHAGRTGNPSKRAYYCIQGRCQACRMVSDCPSTTHYKCQGYQCLKKTCADITCPGIKRCRPETLTCEWICDKDDQSPCDGDRCKVCKAHQCIYKQPECLRAGDCPGDLICRDAQTCHARCVKGCEPLKCQHPYECYRGTCLELCKLQHVIFQSRDSTEVTKASLPLLGMLIPCLQKRATKQLLVMGHDFQGGTMEYNIHKSLTRANKVKELLGKIGIKASRICVGGRGREEPNAPPKATRRQTRTNHRASFRLVDRCP